MDSLKDILNKRKAEKIGESWVKKGEINKKQQQEFEKDQKLLENEREEKFIKKLETYKDFYSTKKVDQVKINQKRELMFLNIDYGPSTPEPKSPTNDEQDYDHIPLPPLHRDEIFKRLRVTGEPVTLFGENEWMRYKRLQQIEQFLEERLTNSNAQCLQPKTGEEDLRQKIQEQEEDIQTFLNKLNKQVAEPIYNPEKPYQHRQAREFELELIKDGTYDSKCEDKSIEVMGIETNGILLKIYNNQKEKYDNEIKKRSVDGCKSIGTYTQSFEYIKPLTDMLKKRKINEEILNSIYCIVRYCVYREYVKAHDKYLELAIGNAPWPMGVTMVGIHERTGRAKIFSSQIAHILNDETQRKYIQSMKRLITFSQKFYPNPDPSKMVDFSGEVTL